MSVIGPSTILVAYDKTIDGRDLPTSGVDAVFAIQVDLGT
jgi:hypothetical protein